MNCGSLFAMALFMAGFSGLLADERTLIKDIKFDVLKMETLENFLKTKLLTLNQQVDELMKTVSTGVGYAATMISTVEDILQGDWHAIMNNSINENKKLLHIITKITDRTNLQIDIRDLHNDLTTAHDRTIELNKGNVGSVGATIDIISTILTKVNTMFNNSAEFNYFRRYPVLAVEPLFSLYASTTEHDLVIKGKDNKLYTHNQLPCKILKTLEDYKKYTVRHRLELIEVMITSGPSAEDLAQLKQAIEEITSLRYNPDGYIESNITIDCIAINGFEGLKDQGLTLYEVLKGPLLAKSISYIKVSDDLFYINKNVNSFTNCYLDYMKFARHEVEKLFALPINTANKMCKSKIE